MTLVLLLYCHFGINEIVLLCVVLLVVADGLLKVESGALQLILFMMLNINRRPLSL